jgi:hypothetical protein
VLLETSLRINNRECLEEELRRLCTATTRWEVLQGEQGVIARLEAEHQQVVTRLIKQASIGAAIRAGFPDIHLHSNRACSIGLTAGDRHRRALLVEVRADEAGRRLLVTTVLGGVGSTHNKALDEFDRALETAGVRFEPEIPTLTQRFGRLASFAGGFFMLLR